MNHNFLRPNAGRSLYFFFRIALILCSSTIVLAQQPTLFTAPVFAANDLPDAPGMGLHALAPGGQSPEEKGTGSIIGVVLDIHDGVVSNATITLVEEGHPGDRITTSDAEGNFSLADLPAGRFKFTVTAPGLETFVSAEINLRAGEKRFLPRIALPLAPSSISVQVTVTQEEIAQEQVTLQEHQRAFGVFPNFYSSYIWDAAPLTTRQKFGLATRSITDPVIFVATGAAAGIEQARNTFPEYGQGTKGYAKRYFSDYGDELSNRMFSSAIYPSIFHQDPRYFYRGSGSVRSRAWYAITRAFVTRGDNGDPQPNYSRILGGLTAGALSETYHQGSDRTVNLFLRNGLIAIGGHAADNVLREFLFKKITPKVPDYANGKPETP